MTTKLSAWINHNLYWAMGSPQTPSAEGGPAQGQGVSTLVMMGLMFGIFYFILIRPQMKAQKEQQKMIAAVKTGDKVVTSGGILGTVANVKEKTVIIKIADTVKIAVLKANLASITPEGTVEVVKG